jgi:hypothetical protein
MELVHAGSAAQGLLTSRLMLQPLQFGPSLVRGRGHVTPKVRQAFRRHIPGDLAASWKVQVASLQNLGQPVKMTFFRVN